MTIQSLSGLIPVVGIHFGIFSALVPRPLRPVGREAVLFAVSLPFGCKMPPAFAIVTVFDVMDQQPVGVFHTWVGPGATMILKSIKEFYSELERIFKKKNLDEVSQDDMRDNILFMGFGVRLILKKARFKS